MNYFEELGKIPLDHHEMVHEAILNRQ